MKTRITKEGFGQFLSGAEPGQVVGYPGDSSMCPLGNYAQACEQYEWRTPSRGWQRAFIDLVDQEVDSLGQGRPITRELALDLLAEATGWRPDYARI